MINFKLESRQHCRLLYVGAPESYTWGRAAQLAIPGFRDELGSAFPNKLHSTRRLSFLIALSSSDKMTA